MCIFCVCIYCKLRFDPVLHVVKSAYIVLPIVLETLNLRSYIKRLALSKYRTVGHGIVLYMSVQTWYSDSVQAWYSTSFIVKI